MVKGHLTATFCFLIFLMLIQCFQIKKKSCDWLHATENEGGGGGNALDMIITGGGGGGGGFRLPLPPRMFLPS